MKLSVIGAGYVGLVTGSCFSEIGNEVMIMDVDQEKVLRLNEGIVPIFEPDLDELIRRNLQAGRLKFTSNFEEAVRHGIVIFVCVNTPQNSDGSADLKNVVQVAKSIGKYINDYKLIVIKSTVPVGTCHRIREIVASEIKGRGLDISFGVASNPEFLREGCAVEDCMRPERIVIGVDDEKSESILRQVYSLWTDAGTPLIVMDILSSEMTKYAANAMLAARISFINEIAKMCERFGADITMVVKGIGSDSRIGSKYLQAGLGFGGSCFPKDLNALISICKKRGIKPRILEQVLKTNLLQREYFLEKIRNFFNRKLTGKKLAIWGLSFKPNTDDLREAPSLYIIDALTKEGCLCSCYDPKAMKNAKVHFKNNPLVVFGRDQYEILEGADALLLVTEWDCFRNPNFERIKRLLKNPVIFDGRNQYDPNTMKSLGFKYFSVGRREV